MLKQLKSKIRDYFRMKEFLNICEVNNLNLDYNSNRNGFFIFKSIFVDREYANYFPFYRKAVIVDVGGHYGYFSIFAANNTHPETTIYTIEPSKENYIQLNKNVKDAEKVNIRSFQLAIGSEDNHRDLFFGKSENHSLFQNYPLLTSSSEKSIVAVSTLESFMNDNQISKIDFLKLDCEGAEYAIIAQASKHVFDRIERIFMEFHDLKDSQYHPEDILRKLVSVGFEIVQYDYNETTLNLNYGKIIAVKPLFLTIKEK